MGLLLFFGGLFVGAPREHRVVMGFRFQGLY